MAGQLRLAQSTDTSRQHTDHSQTISYLCRQNGVKKPDKLYKIFTTTTITDNH
jgi:hypothetical protein